MARQAALVIAPGRGVYNADELGYLGRHHAGREALIGQFDAIRRAHGQETLTALDSATKFSTATHLRGDNASQLIHACACADFLAIDRDAFDIVAVTGNSMGWYIALACAGALDTENGFRLVNSMGTWMHEAAIGGQLVHPFVDDDWVAIPGRRKEMLSLCETISGLHVSIELGGMIVFAGEEKALSAARKKLPPAGDRFPMRLAHHAGFHSPLQAPVSRKALAELPASMFGQPQMPLIDGRGHIWQPKAIETEALHAYTLGNQVIETYDFTAAVQNGLREFAPDIVILLGPGSTLGGAVAQAMIACGWEGLASRTDFVERQKRDPVLLAMGIDKQRSIATGAENRVEAGGDG